ncbi:sugar kinase [Rhizobium sp. P40RR-XXII]|uniref:PfkB family carbohydrate kinase n=1 Tax=unclassified Rhizobium TaxID=2613769 RepID=UPI001456AA56|nr:MULTISPECIES: PfkB family carbohydrate kinase [unclassified Rhizobium]NLR85788.1 sugar kinase [Rhizobium sp. P28RR-XV]NLS19432.1 sugar kinase [Rhizobium sp. P40RR-XXII]
MSAPSIFDPPAGEPRHVLCVGAAVLDTLFRVRVLPQGQGKVLPYDMLQIAEGMASSAAYAVVRLGGKASLWGAVGRDETGDRIVRELDNAGIHVDGMLHVESARSAVSTILVDDDGERLIVPFYDPKLHHAVKKFTAADVAAFDAVLVDVRWPALAFQVLKTARAMGKPAILDGDVAPDGIIEQLAPEATHIIFSEPAAERLTGSDDVAEMARRLKRRFDHAFVCVTAGAAGSHWFNEETGKIQHCPTISIKAVDTLAAGDIFHGAFALAVAEKMVAEDAIRFSSIAAAIKCELFGGRAGAPGRADVIRRSEPLQRF